MDVNRWLLVFLLFVTVMSWQYERSSGVKTLDTHNFDKVVLKPNNLVYVEFYKSSEAKAKTKKSRKVWSEAAQALKGVAILAAVDCEANSELCEKNSIEIFPSIHVRLGDTDFQKYDGKLDKKSIMSDAKDRIPLQVQILKKKKKAKKFVKKHKAIPKALVFVKSAGSLVVKSLAMQLSGRMVFAEILKSDRKLVRQYEVEKFPTLIVISAAEPGEKVKDLVQTFYSGRFTGASLQPWLFARALPGDDDNEILDLVEQLTDDSCMEALCLQGGLCAALIVSQDPSNPNTMTILKEYLPLISQLEDDQLDALYHFVWLDGIGQMEFLQKAFSMEPRDYPQLVVFNAKKLIYTTFVGSFGFRGIKQFLQGVKAGEIKTQPMGLKTLPSLDGLSERCLGMKPPPQMEAKPRKKMKLPKKSRGDRGRKGPVELEEDNWEEKLVNSASNWMVVFIDKEDPDFTKEWKKAARSLKNMVRFGIVDCSELNENLANTYDIDSFPAVKVFRAELGKNDDDVDDYDGDLTMEALTEYALGLLESGDDLVRRIDQKAMDSFFQQEPMQPRMLLISEKPTTPNLFKAVALEYRNELTFAVTSDMTLAKGIGIEISPTVVILNGQLGEVTNGKAELKINRHILPKKKLNVKGLTNICDDLADQYRMMKEHMAKQEGGQETPSHDEL